MRNGCAALAISVFLSLPLCAQQKKDREGDEATNTAAGAETGAAFGSAAGTSQPVVAKGVFPLPATPRPAPLPGPAAASADTQSPALLVPRYEVARMYDYINFSPGGPFENSNSHGGSGSFTYNASRWLGLTAEAAGYNTQRNLFPLTGTNSTVRDRG